MSFEVGLYHERFRECDFCLVVQGGSVFADFDVRQGRVGTVRISFDGYGCCTPDEGTGTRMNAENSAALLDFIDRDDVNNDSVRNLLRDHFERNREVIWEDALRQYGLLPT